MMTKSTALSYVFYCMHRMTMRLTLTQRNNHIVDFATYLRRVQPPVDVEDKGESAMILAVYTAN